jgi:hypothetical protein
MAEEKNEELTEEKEKTELTEEQQKAELKRLQKLTVTKLREEALEKFHDQLKGVHGMRKEELIAAMCELMGIVIEEEHKPQKLDVDKKKLKARMKQLRAEQDEARKNKDKKRVSFLRKRIKKIKRTLHKAA